MSHEHAEPSNVVLRRGGGGPPLVALLLTLLLLPALPAFAEGRGFERSEAPDEHLSWGIGLQLGEPTGLTVKRYLGRDAFDFYLGGAYGPGLRVGADYLWGLAQLASGRTASLDLYVGLGGFVGSLRGACDGFYKWQGSCNGDGYVGGRVPIGLELVFRRAPFTLGLEVGPGFAVSQDHAGFLLDGIFAVRFLL